VAGMLRDKAIVEWSQSGGNATASTVAMETDAFKGRLCSDKDTRDRGNETTKEKDEGKRPRNYIGSKDGCNGLKKESYISRRPRTMV